MTSDARLEPDGGPRGSLRSSLGIADILRRSFGVLGRRLVAFVLLALPVQVLFLAPSVLPLLGSGPADPALADTLGPLFLTFGPLALASIVYAPVQGLIVLDTLADLGGRAPNLARDAATVARRFVPLLAVWMISVGAATLGTALFVLPGLYLSALWYVVVPAVLAEGRGLSALSRSGDLTRGHRWAVMGLFVIVGFLPMLVDIGVGAVIAVASGSPWTVVFDTPLTPDGGVLLRLGASLAIGSLATAFGCVSVAIAYDRLRGLKDGTGQAETAAVFD